MSAIKHTPGPWHVPLAGFTLVHNKAGQLIADCDGNVYIDEKTKNANAELISAAPELLEACKAAYRNLEMTEAYALVDALKAAIAKAEGTL